MITDEDYEGDIQVVAHSMEIGVFAPGDYISQIIFLPKVGLPSVEYRKQQRKEGGFSSIPSKFT